MWRQFVAKHHFTLVIRSQDSLPRLLGERYKRLGPLVPMGGSIVGHHHDHTSLVATLCTCNLWYQTSHRSHHSRAVATLHTPQALTGAWIPWLQCYAMRCAGICIITTLHWITPRLLCHLQSHCQNLALYESHPLQQYPLIMFP